jgi:preprotein translocase subunit SecE
MKKNSQKSKQKSNSKQKALKAKGRGTDKKSKKKAQENRSENKSVRSVQKKGIDKKKDGNKSPIIYIRKLSQFLRDSKTELKKVKWPTRKELLASTAVVIVLTLFVAFYLGLVDFGLMKIIKAIVG